MSISFNTVQIFVWKRLVGSVTILGIKNILMGYFLIYVLDLLLSTFGCAFAHISTSKCSYSVTMYQLNLEIGCSFIYIFLASLNVCCSVQRKTVDYDN